MTDEATIDQVRDLMQQLGGFYGAQTSQDGSFIHVRMLPGYGQHMAEVRQRFPQLRFEVIELVIEPDHA